MADEQYLAAIKEFRVPEVLEKYLPTGFHGFDRDGCPVKIDALGQIDFSGILLSVSAEDVVRTKARQGIRALELCMEQSTISGKTVASNTVIYDLDGAGLRHLYRPGLRMMGQVANMYDHRFPGLTKQVIVLNAPRIFPVIYSIVSPLISKEMRERVKIFGSNWQDDLHKLISPEQLPKHYGGTCERHRGPKCEDVICYGGIVPETYYSLRNVDKSSFLSATVKPGAVFEVDVDVSTVNTILKWQFLTEDYDIKFSLTYKPNDSSDSPETIIPSKKASSHVLLEEGECVCTKAGIYTLVFDNYYSWLHTKHLHYLVKLESSSVPSEGRID